MLLSAPTDTDELARAAAAGSTSALEELLLQIQPEVYRRCRRLLANSLDAEEACQDALLAVSRHIARFEGRARFTTWLYPVVANTITDTHRRLRRRTSVLGIDTTSFASGEQVSTIAGGRVDLLEALEHLAPHYALPVLLRDAWGLGYGEITLQLAIAEGTVKSRVHEGRRQLHNRLTR